MSEMVDRVARAICHSYGSRICGPGQSIATREIGWKGDGAHMDEYVQRHWTEHKHAAELAIGVMRTPTSAMVENAPFRDLAETTWEFMIDEALKP